MWTAEVDRPFQSSERTRQSSPECIPQPLLAGARRSSSLLTNQGIAEARPGGEPQSEPQAIEQEGGPAGQSPWEPVQVKELRRQPGLDADTVLEECLRQAADIGNPCQRRFPFSGDPEFESSRGMDHSGFALPDQSNKAHQPAGERAII